MNVGLRFINICALFFAINSFVFGQMYPEYFYPQHLRPSDPAMAALGYTGTAHRDGLFASFSNPAGLINIDRFEIAYTHLPSHKMPYFSSMVSEDFFGQYTFSIGIPINEYFALGLHYFDLNMGETVAGDETGAIYKKDYTGIRQFQLSLSSKLNLNNSSAILFGSNIKYLQNFYNILDGNVLLFDIGLRSEWISENNKISFGIAVTNLGGKIKYTERFFYGEEELINMFKLAVAIKNSKSYMQKSKNRVNYMLTVEYQKSINSYHSNLWKTLGFGLELEFFSHLSGQLGYIADLYEDDHTYDFEGFTYGLSLDTPEDINIFIPLRCSLAYGRGINLGAIDSNIISISISSNLQ